MWYLGVSGEKMKIIVEMGHPGHVHHFKSMIWELEKRGYEIKICTTDKDIAVSLLDAYGFEYEILGINRGGNLMSKIPMLVKSEYNMLKIARRFKPDLFISRGSPVSAHISRIFHKNHMSFNDTEHSKLLNVLSFPFCDAIVTPKCFKKDLGKKQIRYKGYTELAYLHPNYFTPNSAVLDEIGLSKDDTFIILRFVSWSASHDIGQHGIQNKIELVRELEKYGRVLITSEGLLPKELEKYKIKVSPEKLHDLLYYASLYVGEGATTASECAVLGTHAIYVNTLRLGYTDEEEEKYNLVYNFSAEKTMEKQAFDKALELLKNNNLREEGKRKREKLLNDKIDVTAFMVWFIENYPESFKEMKENQRI
jgi:predicted glycosyltransferase